MARVQSLVLIPSQLCTARVWEHQLQALASQASASVADQRQADSVQGMAERILAGAPARFALAAHGMGGFIAFELWRQAPERIERLALLDTLATADSPQQLARREAYAELVRRGHFAQVIEQRIPILLHPQHRDLERLIPVVRSMAAETGAEAFLRQQQAIMKRPDSRPTLATIRCPTLVVVGSDDLIVSRDDAAAIAAGVPGARFEIVEASGHLTPLEHPEHVAALLRDWLQAGD
jgi:pimeloyl-ACP methyl ester carboxylesterase